MVVITAGFSEVAGGRGSRAPDPRSGPLGRDADGWPQLHGGPQHRSRRSQMNGTFAPVYPPRGNVAMSSQSGALGIAILDYARQNNIGISTFISVGNKADVSGNDSAPGMGGGPGNRCDRPLPGVLREPAPLRPPGTPRRPQEADRGGQVGSNQRRHPGGIEPHRRPGQPRCRGGGAVQPGRA